MITSSSFFSCVHFFSPKSKSTAFVDLGIFSRAVSSQFFSVIQLINSKTIVSTSSGTSEVEKAFINLVYSVKCRNFPPSVVKVSPRNFLIPTKMNFPILDLSLFELIYFTSPPSTRILWLLDKTLQVNETFRPRAKSKKPFPNPILLKTREKKVIRLKGREEQKCELAIHDTSLETNALVEHFEPFERKTSLYFTGTISYFDNEHQTPIDDGLFSPM